MKRSIGSLVGLTLMVAGVVGCGEDDEHEDEGTPTGSVCPTDSTLTYDNFGRPFMEDYCVRCHSSELTGDARNGAPDGHDFDSLFGILVVGEHVDEHAAAGPNATNMIMPPNGNTPTEDERRQLGQWLACEFEKIGDGGLDIDAGHEH